MEDPNFDYMNATLRRERAMEEAFNEIKPHMASIVNLEYRDIQVGSYLWMEMLKIADHKIEKQLRSDIINKIMDGGEQDD